MNTIKGLDEYKLATPAEGSRNFADDHEDCEKCGGVVLYPSEGRRTRKVNVKGTALFFNVQYYLCPSCAKNQPK